MLRKKIIIAFAAGIWALAITEIVAAETLNVEITNVHKAEGTLMIQVLQGEAEFNGDKPPVAALMQRAAEGSMAFSIELPAGDYAVRIMHDVNGNGELDANFIGIPTEPWAFSNNATGQFGPPKWQDVMFTLQGKVEQSIQLNK